MRLKLILLLALATLALVFMAQNASTVAVRFLIWHLSMSISLFVFLLFALGAVVGWLLHSYSQHRRGKEKAV
jgi:uncharacterized membrane protein YciS (DUF1049 family)